MSRQFALAIGLVAILSSPCSALTTLIGGNHVFSSRGESTFPIIATSDSGESLSGIDLYLVMDPNGPIVTKLDLINGTVFQNNNEGQGDFGLPEYNPPSREPATYINAIWNSEGGYSTGVPTGIVAFVTVDFTGVAPGVYSFSLSSDLFGPSAAYNLQGLPGSHLDGTLELVPEPSSVAMGLPGLAGLGLMAFRCRRARSVSPTANGVSRTKAREWSFVPGSAEEETDQAWASEKFALKSDLARACGAPPAQLVCDW